MQIFDINGTQIAFLDSGRGIPLVLLHGFPLDHSMWSGQIAGLAGRCRVVVPDLRGFGASGASEGAVAMEQMADDLAALLDALEIREPIILGGLSMGGYVAFEFWRKYPAKLKALILCDTRPEADSPEIAANRLATADRVLGEGPRPIVDALLPKLFSPRTRAEQPQIVAQTERVMLAADPRGVAAAARGMARRRDFRAELKNIDLPALVLVGADDALTPPAAMQSWAATIPHAVFRVIADAGHMAPLEQPAPVNAAIESFLDSLA
ncbi:MAG: alpha/beta fold hydrolase [Pirellulales bacterium]|nr:alpha/beta fold hydrolase [Pirellulales bacterium]